MRRKAAAVVLLAALGGWGAPEGRAAGKYMSQAFRTAPEGVQTGARYAEEAPHLIGPHGQPVPVMAPASYTSPSGADYARAMLMRSYPPDMVRQAAGGRASPLTLTSGACPPGGCGPGGMMPPGMGMMPPGMMPPGMMGMAGGGGLMMPGPGMGGPPGAVAAVGALTGAQAGPFAARRTAVRFVGPADMEISWYAPKADGTPGFSAQYLVAPARYNFLQSSIYRLKLSRLPNRPGVALYPTLEVAPATGKTATFLAHSSVPVSFTEDDFEQVAAGNFVVKVIYLPDPQFQDLAAVGPDEVVSSRLEPGVDPIVEAKRRGTILLVIRLGNIDLEAPNTPPMDAPDANAPRPPMPQPPAGPMVPPGVRPPAGPPPVQPPARPGQEPAPGLGKANTPGAVQPVGYKMPAGKPTVAGLAGSAAPTPRR